MSTEALRDRLQAGLVVAMKAKDTVAVKAMRSALAAIANAEAVTGSVGSGAASGSSQHVAGGVVGLGAGDAPRRELSELDMLDIVDREITERVEHAREYDDLGQTPAADQLRAEAAVLESYLAS